MATDNSKLNSVTRKGRKKVTASVEQLKTEFERELEQGLIKKQTFKGVVTYFNSKGERVNSNGEPVTKSGLPDKRKGNGDASHWKHVAAKNKSNKEVIKTAVVESDSESDAEFEIEIDDTVKQQPPQQPPQPPQPPPQPVIDNKYEQLIKEQEEIRKKYDEQLKKAKEENDKLKSGLVFNDHLSRISHMARNTKLKF